MNDSNTSITQLEASFPIVDISLIAQKESWRKEIYNPATSTHKWWAKRLGSVFGAIIVSANTEPISGKAIKPFEKLTIFDPFAGSGTTCVEGLKFGSRVIGFDINPVATLVQRQSINQWDSKLIDSCLKTIESQCKNKIDKFHVTQKGNPVLYYFWVAIVNCPDCNERVRLFDSPIFSSNAYPKKKPQVKIVCPECLEIGDSLINFESESCTNGHPISPKGAVSGANMNCKNGHNNKIVKALEGTKPSYEMYAKIVLDSNNSRVYEGITDWDRDLYSQCAVAFKKLENPILPTGNLESGSNTAQALNWGFHQWSDFFNVRQLYSLSIIAKAIKQLPKYTNEREALIALFSGTLEFNNLFCSFKGEGTGAVRHMFANHVLKPERTPLEAHPWGNPSSSGSFSTLYKSRIIKADQFKKKPFTILSHDQGLVKSTTGIHSIEHQVASSWKEFSEGDLRAYLHTGSSHQTDFPSSSVDLIITDPPYMDNVHYAELADFFNSWLVNMDAHENYPELATTRSSSEVQQANASDFGNAIGLVWTECSRVLKDDGLLAFTFHQARIEGWQELLSAIYAAGFHVTSIQPIKGEMSTSLVKSGVREPSNLDSIIICRKTFTSNASIESDIAFTSFNRLLDLSRNGVLVGIGDVRSVMRGSVISDLMNAKSKLMDAVSIDKVVEEYISNFHGEAD